MSRIPGIQQIFGWALTFFPKGLVIRVIFSLVIWFVIVFRLLTSFAVTGVMFVLSILRALLGRRSGETATVI